MKIILPAVIAGALMCASCANSLEQIVEDHHQARIDAANANRPLTHGANDGLGSAIAETAPHGMSLSDGPPESAQMNARLFPPAHRDCGVFHANRGVSSQDALIRKCPQPIHWAARRHPCRNQATV